MKTPQDSKARVGEINPLFLVETSCQNLYTVRKPAPRPKSDTLTPRAGFFIINVVVANTRPFLWCKYGLKV